MPGCAQAGELVPFGACPGHMCHLTSVAVSGSSPQQRLPSSSTPRLCGHPDLVPKLSVGNTALGTICFESPLPSQRLLGTVSSHVGAGVLILIVYELMEIEGFSLSVLYSSTKGDMMRTLM